MNNRSDYFSLSGRTFKEFRNEVNRFEKNLVFRRVKMGEIYFSIMPKKPGTGTEGIPMTTKNWERWKETARSEFGITLFDRKRSDVRCLRQRQKRLMYLPFLMTVN